MRIKAFIALAGSIVFLSGCSHFAAPAKIEQKVEADWSVVAGVDGGNQQLHSLIREVLNEKGIECGMSGSLAYDILVPTDRIAEARSVLQEDPRLKQEKIWFSPIKPTRH